MEVPARVPRYLLLAPCAAVFAVGACGDKGASQAAQAAGDRDTMIATTSSLSQDISTVRLADLPAQISDYHRTTHVAGCSDMGGHLTVDETAYARRVEFNGDGRADYVLLGSELECSAGASAVCGNGTCPFDVFVSQNGTFVQSGVVGHEAAVRRDGDRDYLMVTTRDGVEHRWGWSGRSFDLMPAGAATTTQAATQGAGSAIRLNVTLTPAARSAFARTGERVVVKAFYSGSANANYQGDDLDEMGDLNLGSDEQTLSATGGEAVLANSKINQSMLQHMSGQAQVRITVWGSGASYLSCELGGAVAELSRRPQNLVCDVAR